MSFLGTLLSRPHGTTSHHLRHDVLCVVLMVFYFVDLCCGEVVLCLLRRTVVVLVVSLFMLLHVFFANQIALKNINLLSDRLKKYI